MSSTHALSSQHTDSHIASRSARAGRRVSSRQARGLSWLEIAALIVIVIALIYGVMAGVSRPAAVTSQARIHVDSGDTLWAIAQAHPVPGQSTAQVAETIAQLNGLDGSQVAAGQSLMVPSAGDDVTLAAR